MVPFAAGWYTTVHTGVMHLPRRKIVNASEVNCGPLSLTKSTRKPWWLKTPIRNSISTLVDTDDVKAISSHLASNIHTQFTPWQLWKRYQLERGSKTPSRFIHLFTQLKTYVWIALSIPGNQYSSCKCCLVRTTLWWLSCKSAITVCCSATGTTRQVSQNNTLSLTLNSFLTWK